MKFQNGAKAQNGSLGTGIAALVIRTLLAVGIPLIAFYVLYLGFIFLRDSKAPQIVITTVAIIWGVGGVALLFWIFNNLVEKLPDVWKTRLLPFVFVGPAMAILSWYLAIPTVRTFWISLFGRDGPPAGLNLWQQVTSDSFVGLSNYSAVFSDSLMLEAFRNNLMCSD
jgi:alpha-glucoside transport system permease protein